MSEMGLELEASAGAFLASVVSVVGHRGCETRSNSGCGVENGLKEEE